MIYTENAISAARCAEAAWRAAAFAMENAKLAETLQKPSNIIIVAEAVVDNYTRAGKAHRDANLCCIRGFGSEVYSEIETATSAASNAVAVAHDAAKRVTGLLEKANE